MARVGHAQPGRKSVRKAEGEAQAGAAARDGEAQAGAAARDGERQRQQQQQGEQQPSAGEEEGLAMRDFMDEFKCPITMSVMVDPIVASDGFTYEAHALRDLFKHSDRPKSPRTNVRLASKEMRKNINLRNIISKTVRRVGRSVLSKEDLAAYFLGLARVRFAEKAPDDAETLSLLHLAAEFDKPEAEKLLAGFKLAKQVKEFRDKCDDETYEALFGSINDDGDAVLTSYRSLEDGSRLRIINDSAKLEELCRRAAPNASSSVGFSSRMRECCGCTGEVVGRSNGNKAYRVRFSSEASTWLFPFDACILVYERRDGASPARAATPLADSDSD